MASASSSACGAAAHVVSLTPIDGQDRGFHRQARASSSDTLPDDCSFLFKVGPRWFMRHSPGKVSVLVNKVRALLVGSPGSRRQFAQHLHDERGVERLGMFG